MKKDFIEKAAPFIGKGIYGVFLIISVFSSLKELTENQKTNYFDTASFVGGVLGILLFFYLLYLFFKQIYLLVSRSEKYFSGESSKSTFRTQVILSLVTTLLLSCFIITIPFLIPQYIVLLRSKNILSDNNIASRKLSDELLIPEGVSISQNISDKNKKNNLIRGAVVMIGLLLVLSIYNSLTKKKESPENVVLTDNKLERKCTESAFWSDTEVCIPKLQDMQNIMRDSTFSSLVETMLTPENETLAIYMDNETVSGLSEGQTLQPRKTFQINAQKTFVNKPISNGDLKYVTANQSSYFTDNWSEFQKYVDSNYQEMNFDKPVIIEKYSLTDNSNQLVCLTKYGNSDVIQVGVLNNFIVGSRLFQGNFFIPYEGQQSITLAKSQNDYMMHKILQENID